MIKTRQELIENPEENMRPHVVLLGAGASLAAFPQGDAKGQKLPLMDNLVDILDLQPILEKTSHHNGSEKNFEAIYGQLASDPVYEGQVKEIEKRIFKYFSDLSIPLHATIYDQLLISLRPKDAIFTFNWDPFLFDAYQRNREAIPLPEIFFLHGNVRIGACLEHDTWGARQQKCPGCARTFTDIPLLYPIEQKDYSANSYISRNWEAAKSFFKEAFTLTIFGYGAPSSDTDAVELLRAAWTSRSDRTIEHIEVIDKGPHKRLYERWAPFTPSHHFRVRHTFDQSRIARWPRRSCESLRYPMMQGLPCEDFPLPAIPILSDLQQFASKITKYEKHQSC